MNHVYCNLTIYLVDCVYSSIWSTIVSIVSIDTIESQCRYIINRQNRHNKSSQIYRYYWYFSYIWSTIVSIVSIDTIGSQCRYINNRQNRHNRSSQIYRYYWYYSSTWATIVSIVSIDIILKANVDTGENSRHNRSE